MRILKAAYLNILFYCMFLITSATLIPLLITFITLNTFFIPRRRVMKRFRRSISFYGKAITSLPFPMIRVRYEDRTGSDSPGPFIYVCNHRSTADAFLMSVLPVEAVQVVNTWPFKIPVLGFFAKKAGYLNINLMSPDEFFSKAAKLLEEGVSIIFFPEGTRSTGGKTGNFRGAAFRLFLKSMVPVIPICISGNEKVIRKGSLLLHSGVIRVRTLPPITWKDYGSLNPYQIKTMVRRTMEDELALMDGAA